MAVRDGAVVAHAGDPRLTCSLRSVAKPFQALPLLRAGVALDETEVAIACASHQAEPEQLDAVRRLLARAGAPEDALECGSQEERPAGPLFHNCSGKHAGMLLLCAVRGWERAGYRLAAHPLQRGVLAAVAEASEVRGESIATAIDGCGVVCFALSLERTAAMFARLPALEGGARAAAAMRAHPHLVGGAGALDTAVMRCLPGWTAKRGAEGLMCVSGPGGLGVALKADDGNPRALPSALAVFLAALGHPAPSLGRVELRNSRGELVGEVGRL